MSGSDSGGTTIVGPEEVLAFWRSAGPDKWFEKDPAFDATFGVEILSVPPSGDPIPLQQA